MTNEFKKDISTENNHNELMFSFYQIFGNNLLKTTQLHVNYGNKLTQDILVPIAQFTQSIIERNSETMASIQKVHNYMILYMLTNFAIACYIFR